MNIAEALVYFDQYLKGDTQYAHLKKEVSDKHRKELIKYCTLFAKSLKNNHNLRKMKPGMSEIMMFLFSTDNWRLNTLTPKPSTRF